MELSSHGMTEAGCVRPVNQDRILLDDALGLYVVCDGLGGRRRGEIAAEIAISAVRQYIESSTDPMDVTWPYGYNPQLSYAANRVLTATRLANRHVWRRSEESLEFLGMGTTISAALIELDMVAIANIGDSRVYLFREGRLEQLSVDDTIAGGPGVTSQLPREPGDIPIRNILTRAAGSQETADAHLRECRLRGGDVLLLCSDGLHGCIDDDSICAVLNSVQDHVTEAAARLLAMARSAGAPDNVSAVIVRYGAVRPKGANP